MTAFPMRRREPGPGRSEGTRWVFSGFLRSALEQGHRLAPWCSLDGRQLYVHAKTAGYLYQAQVRAELTKRLGVRFGPVTNGYADLAGVPRGVIEAFSRRRADILAALAEVGHRTARAAQIATLATRTGKTHTRHVTLRSTWRVRAAELGFGPREAAALTGTGAREPACTRPDLTSEAGWLLGPRGLTANASAFTRREVLQGWCGRLTGGASVLEVERLPERRSRPEAGRSGSASGCCVDATTDRGAVMTTTMPGLDPPLSYEFRIRGHLDDRWANWFEGLTLTRETDGATTLRGTVIDQAALHGILHKLRDLGMTLISMQTVGDSQI